MSSPVTICNRALQKLGAQRITTLEEDSSNARACKVAYEPVRNAELKAHPWSFAKKRAILAQNATAPLHGGYNSFALPADYLGLREPDNGYNFPDIERQIEGRDILSRESSVLNLSYTAKIDDVNAMDAIFVEALATKLAFELCEEITQSNTKKESLREDYKQLIREARRSNAIERNAQLPPDDSWVTGRR